MLPRSAARCMTTTNAQPVSANIFLKKWMSASTPPAEAPIAMVRGRYRFRILVKGPKRLDIQAFLRRVLADGPSPRGGIRVDVDVDPQSFL